MKEHSADNTPVKQWVWHVHHDVLLEPLTEPIENRIAHIKEDKPKEEQATRLRLLKPVAGQIPADQDKAQADWDKAHADQDKAWADGDKAWADGDKARADLNKAQADQDKAQADQDKAQADPAVEALHEKECPGCPWNGRTIFS